MQKRMVMIGVGALVVALMVVGLCVAQPPQGGGQGGPGGPGGRQFDPARMAEMRQQMMENLRQELKVDAEAWKVMEPRIQKVMDLNRQAMSGGGRGMFGMMGMRGNRGGNNGPGGNRPQRDPSTMTAVEKAQEQLQTTLDNESASPEEIAAKLKDFRAAREKAKQELATAQEELRKILTPRQEAQLVIRGQLN
jgi:hypothetical protein